jgi:hypothetical protein
MDVVLGFILELPMGYLQLWHQKFKVREEKNS